MMEQQTQEILDQPIRTESEEIAANAHFDPAAVEAAAAVDEFLAAIAVEQRKRKRRVRQFRIGLGAVLGVVCILILMLAIRTERWVMLSALFCLTALWATVAASNSHKEALTSLAQFNDPRAVGPFAEALEYGDEELLPIAEKALIRLLPRLKAGDSEMLNTEQRRCLHRALNKRYGKNKALALAILKAFEQIGDERDLPTVERLAATSGSLGSWRRRAGRRATGKPTWIAGFAAPTWAVGFMATESEVRRAAEECLPYLRQRSGEKTVQQSLLRAAGLSETPSAMLLRPALGSRPDNPLELLRASVQEARTREGAQTELTLAILDGLAATGDARALPYVRQLATADDVSDAVRAAAQRCENVLQRSTG